MTPLPPKHLASAAFTSSGLFVLLGIGLSKNPNAHWVEYTGLGAHLALLPLAAQLPAPAWARAMGYAWVAVDSTASGAVLNGNAPAAVLPARLGGHVLGAVWIAGAAQALPPPARWLGRALALSLGGHSLLTPWPWYQKKPVLYYAGGPLLLGWLLALGGLLRCGRLATS